MLSNVVQALSCFFFGVFFLWACLVWGKRKENSVRAKQSWRGRVKTNSPHLASDIGSLLQGCTIILRQRC